MINRINQYLILKYPLIWNTRLVWALLTLSIVHLLYFAIGYLTVNDFGELQNYEYRYLYDSPSMVLFSILASLCFFIIWLLYYFRHNALKSFYPISNWYLVKEFIIVLCISFFAVTFMFSYQLGFNAKVKSMASTFNYEDMANDVNLANCFVANETNINAYSNHNSCEKIEKRQQYDATTTANDDKTRYANEGDHGRGAIKVADTMFYLNFCQNSISSMSNKVDLRTPQQNHAIAKRLLLGKHWDSIRSILQGYSSLMTKLKVKTNFKVDKQMNELKDNPLLMVRLVYSNNDIIYVESGNFQPEDYLSLNNFHSVFNGIEWAQNYTFFKWDGELMIYMFIMMGLGLAIFTFRITKLKPWIIALVSLLIWSVITGLYYAINRNSNSGPGFFLVYPIVFGLLTIIFILGKQFKTFAAVAFILVNWSLIYVVQVVYYYIEKSARQAHYLKYDDNIAESKMSTEFVPYHSYWTEVNYASFLLIILVVCLISIPLAKKWHSNAE